MSKHYKLVFYSRIFLFLAAFYGSLSWNRQAWWLWDVALLYGSVQPFSRDFTLYLLKVMSRLGENWQRPSLLRLKGGVTMSIMITCVIYHFLLAPIATNFYTLENFLCHYIVPLWFLADTLFLTNRVNTRFGIQLCGRFYPCFIWFLLFLMALVLKTWCS